MLSVTTLTSYLYCPRKLYLQKVLGYEEIPKEFLVRGLIKHRVFEEMNNAEKDLICSLEPGLTYQMIVDAYSRKYAQILRRVILQSKSQLKMVQLSPMNAFKQYISLFRTEAELRAINIFSFMKKNRVSGVELWESLTPKLKSEYKVVSQRLQLTGKIDQIQVFPKRIVPIELKTGKAPREGVWENHKIQLAAYVLLLEDFFNIPVSCGFVRYVDDENPLRLVQMNAFLKDKVKDLTKEVQDLLQSKKIPGISKNENKCRNCSLKERCHSKEVIEKRKV